MCVNIHMKSTQDSGICTCQIHSVLSASRHISRDRKPRATKATRTPDAHSTILRTCPD